MYRKCCSKTSTSYNQPVTINQLQSTSYNQPVTINQLQSTMCN